MLEVIRDMGRIVPEGSRDPCSEEYFAWLAELVERGEIHPTKMTDPMITVGGKRVRVLILEDEG